MSAWDGTKNTGSVSPLNRHGHSLGKKAPAVLSPVGQLDEELNLKKN